MIKAKHKDDDERLITLKQIFQTDEYYICYTFLS